MQIDLKTKFVSDVKLVDCLLITCMRVCHYECGLSNSEQLKKA
jgi:hypothetical protein